MEKQQEKNIIEAYSIDKWYVVKMLWKRAWLIVLCGLLGAVLGFSRAKFTINPTYSSSVKLYVNNSTFSLGSTSVSISAAQITAAQQLTKTYAEILKSRTTLERINQEAGTKYNWMQLSSMISCTQCNETEILLVKVIGTNPDEACKIANTVALVLPERITEIIDGSSMVVVDTAIPEYSKVGPNITRHTAMGLLLGVFLSAVLIVGLAILDDAIHSEEYILRTYDYPILGRVPNLMSNGSKSYGYYYSKHKKKSN